MCCEGYLQTVVEITLPTSNHFVIVISKFLLFDVIQFVLQSQFDIAVLSHSRSFEPLDFRYVTSLTTYKNCKILELVYQLVFGQTWRLYLQRGRCIKD